MCSVKFKLTSSTFSDRENGIMFVPRILSLDRPTEKIYAAMLAIWWSVMDNNIYVWFNISRFCARLCEYHA